jgi:hypothetical protein
MSMMIVIIALLVAVTTIPTMVAADCISDCDAAAMATLPVASSAIVFCGTDGLTHNTYQAALSCYTQKCYVTALYAG